MNVERFVFQNWEETKEHFKKKKAWGYKRIWHIKEIIYLMECTVHGGARKADVELQKGQLGPDSSGPWFHAELFELYLINYGQLLKVFEQGLLMDTNPIL